MRPTQTQQNRRQLFFLYFMDCQTPQKPGGSPDQTWDVAERAVRGLYELFAERGLEHCLGFCSEPEVARRQSALLQEMERNGCWQALHFQVRGYRPPGATEDYDWVRPMTWYDYDEQLEAIRLAKDDWEQSMGMAADSFGACCAQANDYTFPILAELGVRQCYVTAPGRWNPSYEIGHLWWGAFPHTRHCSSKSRLAPGELDLYEFPITRGLEPIPAGAPDTWTVTDCRAEAELSFDETMAICEASVRDQIRRDHPVLYLHNPTHNTWDVTDRTSGRRRAVETTIEVGYALAEKLGLELTPTTLAELHAEADRLNAY
ncbi:MAG: hypothetical protein HPY69_05195 [Armatimonadetes bacterium]|nr:hypothetical protein [Armatimonadota bacterium]